MGAICSYGRDVTEGLALAISHQKGMNRSLTSHRISYKKAMGSGSKAFGLKKEILSHE